MRILVVEDDAILGASLKRALEKRGYGVDWLADGESAAQIDGKDHYSCALLDVNLPHLSGLEVLRRWRSGGNEIPVLLLTARDTVEHKVEGLDSGADDYLSKPFDLDELLARVRALTRRREHRTSQILRCGNVAMDTQASVVTQAEVQVILTAREYRILKLLMERANKYITKSDIEFALYDADHMAESNTVEVGIYQLRKKLGAGFIKSLRGVGYMVTSA